MKKSGRHIFCIVFIIAVAFCTFLKIQTDDEIYLGIDGIASVAENSDISEGVLRVNAKDITGEDGFFARSKSLDLPKGVYLIETDHENAENADLIFMDGDEPFASQELEADAGRTVCRLNVERNVNDFTVRFFYNGKDDIVIKHLLISSEGRLIYNDNLALGILLIILAVFFDIYIGKKGNIPAAALFGAAAVFVSSFPLLSDSFLYGHDMMFHMMRVEGIKDALLDGQFPAVIYPKAAYGHGYIGALYPNLFLYIPAVLRLMGISALNSYRTAFFLINIFSYLTAYLCGKGIAGSERGGIVCAILYTLAPFRLIDIYFRSTLGEAVAMVFFPLVLLGIYNLTIGDASKWRVLAVGMSGLIESHILSAVFGGIICGVFFLVFAVKLFKEKRILKLILTVLASIAANLGFFIPFFYYREQNLQLDDTIRRFNPANAAQPMYEIFSSLPRLLTDKDDSYLRREMIPTLGMIGLVCIFLTLALVLYCRENMQERRFMLTALVMEIAIVYTASDLFPWRTLEKFEGLFRQLMLLEHPWRLFGIAVCLFAPAAALALERLELLKTSHTAVAAGLIILTLITVVPQYDVYFNNRSRAIYTETGNTAYSYNVDYMPSQFKDMASLKEDREPVPDEGIDLTFYGKSGTKVFFGYESKNGGFVRFPLLYYKGYRAFDEKDMELPVGEGELGDVCVALKGNSSGAVSLRFTQPMMNLIALILSCIGIIIFLPWKDIQVWFRNQRLQFSRRPVR